MQLKAHGLQSVGRRNGSHAMIPWYLIVLSYVLIILSGVIFCVSYLCCTRTRDRLHVFSYEALSESGKRVWLVAYVLLATGLLFAGLSWILATI